MKRAKSDQKALGADLSPVTN